MLAKLLQLCQLFATPWTVVTRLLCSRDSPGKNTGVGCCALLQGIFPTQGWNQSLLCLLHWQVGSSATWEAVINADYFAINVNPRQR